MTVRRLSSVLILIAILAPSSLMAQQPPPVSPSMDQQLAALLDAGVSHSSEPQLLLKASDLYLEIGNDTERNADKRIAAYQEGARLARRAWQLRESNAEAHYLYAANLGSAAQLKGVMASALTIRELKVHVSRALELRPDHAPSLHMMGMILEELPWMLGGDAQIALTYLQRAVAVDPKYDHARLDLAKAYIRRQAPDAARRELTVILTRSHSNGTNRHYSEATQLLASLDSERRAGRRP
jgi:hypothetical protein